MSSSSKNIQIVFASLPEERDVESSAAKEFALRAAEQFKAATGGDDVEIHHLADWNKDEFLASSSGSEKANNKKTVFLISCGPDGSVHRSVRRTTKWIKEQEGKIQEDEKQSIPITAAVALLGHAVCKTSAEQMEDEVYSSGRRLAKAIQRITNQPISLDAPYLLETQIELEPPEEKFDGWITSWVNLDVC